MLATYVYASDGRSPVGSVENDLACPTCHHLARHMLQSITCLVLMYRDCSPDVYDVRVEDFQASANDDCDASEALKMLVWAIRSNRGVNKELKGECLRPPDVASLGVPVPSEGSCAPMLCQNDANVLSSHLRTHCGCEE